MAAAARSAICRKCSCASGSGSFLGFAGSAFARNQMTAPRTPRPTMPPAPINTHLSRFEEPDFREEGVAEAALLLSLVRSLEGTLPCASRDEAGSEGLP